MTWPWLGVGALVGILLGEVALWLVRTWVARRHRHAFVDVAPNCYERLMAHADLLYELSGGDDPPGPTRTDYERFLLDRANEARAVAEEVRAVATEARRFRDDPRQAFYDPTILLTRVADRLAPDTEERP